MDSTTAGAKAHRGLYITLRATGNFALQFSTTKGRRGGGNEEQLSADGTRRRVVTSANARAIRIPPWTKGYPLSRHPAVVGLSNAYMHGEQTTRRHRRPQAARTFPSPIRAYRRSVECAETSTCGWRRCYCVSLHLYGEVIMEVSLEHKIRNCESVERRWGSARTR